MAGDTAKVAVFAELSPSPFCTFVSADAPLGQYRLPEPTLSGSAVVLATKFPVPVASVNDVGNLITTLDVEPALAGLKHTVPPVFVLLAIRSNRTRAT
jgi:hypothetical protein